MTDTDETTEWDNQSEPPDVRRISFVTSGHEADERLIREYVVPAMDRLESIDGCHGVRFSRFGTDPRYDASEIKLGIYGDWEAVIAAERDRWDELVADGVIESWERDGRPFADADPAVQAFLREAYVLGSRMAREYYRAFDERPGFVAELRGANDRPIGLAVALHILVNNIGYDLPTEMDGYVTLLRDRVFALSQTHGYDAAREWIEDTRDELDELESRLDELEAADGFDYYDGPN